MSRSETKLVRLGLVGAGLIGNQHVKAMSAVANVELSAALEPDPDPSLDLPLVDDMDQLLNASDGVILAVPNALHRPLALECIAAGKPVLIEKPLANTASDGGAIVHAAAESDVPILVGHHRRHNPIVQNAKSMIANGALGQLTTLHAQCWLPKPASYFEQSWRQTKGAGPLFINLIHDVDLMLHLCGPIASVYAMQSNAVRAADVEETMAVVVTFSNGMLGTMNLSDAAVGPWSWELTAKENPAYPATDQTCYWIGGTSGALALPNLTHWHQKNGADWWAPISATHVPTEHAHPLQSQIKHFADVIKGNATPLVSGADGLQALKVIEAIKTSANEDRKITLST